MRRSTIAQIVISLFLCAVVVWQYVDHAWSSIQLSFAAEQAEIFDEMAAKASESLGQSPPDVRAAVRYLQGVQNYYPSGTKQTRGSQLDSIVERCRAFAEWRIIEQLREATGTDLGNDAERWIREFGDEPSPDADGPLSALP